MTGHHAYRRRARTGRRSPALTSAVRPASRLPGGTRRPVFDDDLWDFTAVAGLPNQMSKVSRRFDFTAIASVCWRLVAKEQIMAMLAPRHEAVMTLPRAYRTPLHLLTASGRLAELTRFLNWLTRQGVTSLGDLGTSHCEAYLAHRRYLLDENGHVAGERSPATRRAAAQTVVDLVNHRELFTLDRVPGDLRPWGGAAPSAIAEMPCGTGQNKTPPVGDSVLQPMLAAALYLTDTLGPHTIELIKQVRDADRRWSHAHGNHVFTSRLPAEEITQVLADYEHRSEPLPLAAEHTIRDRLAAGWSAEDPLTPISLGLLARQAGFTQFWRQWIPHLREQIEATLKVVGAEKPVRPRRCRRRPRRRGRRQPVDAAAGPAASRGPGRDRPHRRDRPPRRRVRNALQRADGDWKPAAAGRPSTTALAWSATGWPARSSRASRSAGPPTSGSSSSPPTRPPSCSSSSTTIPRTGTRCSAGSPSTSATPGSGTGSTALPASASDWPPSPGPPSASGRCAARWRSSSPTGPAACSPRNCTSSTSPWPQPKATPPAQAARRPSCWPRSTSTRPSATWI